MSRRFRLRRVRRVIPEGAPAAGGSGIRRRGRRETSALKGILRLWSFAWYEETCGRRKHTCAPQETFSRTEELRVRVWGVCHVGAEDGAVGGRVADDEDVARPRATVSEFGAVLIEGGEGGAITIETIG